MGSLSVNFANFLNSYETKTASWYEKCLSQGGSKTSDEIAQVYRKGLNDLQQESFDVLPKKWRKLASKENLTERQSRKLDKMYKKGFLKFGNKYKKYLDKKFGNGDGKLTTDEFIKSELKEDTSGIKSQYSRYLDGTLYDNDETIPVKNLAAHIDLNNDKEIDEKEMAALLSMYDMDVNTGNFDGKLKYSDIMSNDLSLMENINSEYGRSITEKLKSMYAFLFPPQK